MNSIRAFFALPVPAGTEYELIGLVERLERRYAGKLAAEAELRWVKPANYHITLAFLGNIQPGRLPALEDIARSAAADIKAETLFIERLDWLPNAVKARVMVALLAPNRVLSHWQKQLVQRLHQQGFHCHGERFCPHISLARTRGGAAAIDVGAEAVSAALDMDELVLYRSELSSAGPRYTRLVTAPISATL